LSELCTIISEDYSSRASGLPDLVIWDVSKSEERCMFVEVKGPGDSLMENQKVRLTDPPVRI
jgi:Fanconi-associated nuclease 1